MPTVDWDDVWDAALDDVQELKDDIEDAMEDHSRAEEVQDAYDNEDGSWAEDNSKKDG